MEELRFSSEAIEAVVLPDVGARMHRLRVFGHDLLRTPDTPERHLREPFSWGAYVMAPWCNRVDPGPIRIGSKRLDLASNFADGSAIHGLVYARPWQPGVDGTLHVSCGGGSEGWPWTFAVSVRFEVVDLSMRIALRLTNQSDDPMPAGLGIHPWFRRPLLVAIHGDSAHPLNVATEPEPVPVRGPYDLRTMGPMAEGIDATWADLAEPPVELAWPDLGLRADMRITSHTRHVVAANIDELDAIAVEPQTHAPQGIRRLLNGEPGGVAIVDPGQALDLAVELVFSRDPD